MTRIYLDVNDRVCVDTSPHGHAAERAALDRMFLANIVRLDRVQSRIIRILEQSGRDASASRKNLCDIRALAADVRLTASERN